MYVPLTKVGRSARGILEQLTPNLVPQAPLSFQPDLDANLGTMFENLVVPGLNGPLTKLAFEESRRV